MIGDNTNPLAQGLMTYHDRNGGGWGNPNWNSDGWNGVNQNGAFWDRFPSLLPYASTAATQPPPQPGLGFLPRPPMSPPAGAGFGNNSLPPQIVPSPNVPAGDGGTGNLPAPGSLPTQGGGLPIPPAGGTPTPGASPGTPQSPSAWSGGGLAGYIHSLQAGTPVEQALPAYLSSLQAGGVWGPQGGGTPPAAPPPAQPQGIGAPPAPLGGLLGQGQGQGAPGSFGFGTLGRAF